MPRVIFLAFIIAVSIQACSPYFKNDRHDNSPTSGELVVYCEPGLYELTYYMAYTFMAQYPAAHVTVVASSAENALQALKTNACELIIINRTLNPSEMQSFAKQQERPKLTSIAHNAVACVASKQHPDTSISMQELQTILQPLGNSKQTLIRVNTDQTVWYSVCKTLFKTQIPKSLIGITKTDFKTLYEALITNPNAIGIIDFAQCADRDDTLMKSLKAHLKILALEGVYPSASNLKTKTYPLPLVVYTVRTTGDFTLAKGFEAFVAGPKGQWMVLKRGLLPARQQERNVQVHLEPL
jgi:phosphate transport system substrate-binding protein